VSIWKNLLLESLCKKWLVSCKNIRKAGELGYVSLSFAYWPLCFYSGVRPFGVSLLIAGYDEVDGPTLYQVDPSGSYWAWKASAIGKNMINAKTFLEKR
jgi:hypothetical protein